MSESKATRSAWATFSLFHLLVLTAVIALSVAITMAYLKNRRLFQQRKDLLSLSKRLPSDTEGKLVSADMPYVADDFRSWQVYVPDEMHLN